MFDCIVVMSKGKVLQVGMFSDIYEVLLNWVVVDFIGEINFFEGQVDVDGVCLVDGQWLVVMILGSGVVILVICLECIELVVDGQLEGVLENIVYVGIDIVYYLNVVGQLGFCVCQQNCDGVCCLYSLGVKVWVWIFVVVIWVFVE